MSIRQALTSNPLYPTEESRSEFFKQYTAEHMQEVIKRFLSLTQQVQSDLSVVGGRKCSSALHRFIELYQLWSNQRWRIS